MPYYDATVLHQLPPVAPVTNSQLQLPHLSKCQERLTVEVSESSGDLISRGTMPANGHVVQRSLSSQQRCSDASSGYCSTVNNSRAAASAQSSHSYLHQTEVSSGPTFHV